MKHFLKVTTLLFAMLVLGACSNNNDASKEKTNDEASTEVSKDKNNDKDKEEKKKDDDTKDKEEDDKAEDSNSDDKEDTNKDDEQASSEEEKDKENKEQEEASEDAVSFKFYINGEEDTDLAFSIEDAEGMSVLEALESQEDLDVNFNEEEGIIDSINNIDNNYETWETWAYLLNGQFAEIGVVSQTLSAGDEIAWYYGTTDNIPANIVPAQ